MATIRGSTVVFNAHFGFKCLVTEFSLTITAHAHSKQLYTGHLDDACAKTSDIVIKIKTSAPGVEIRIVFLICYLQSLYEIELGRYFCPEYVGHVVNQNILIDVGKTYVNKQ